MAQDEHETELAHAAHADAALAEYLCRIGRSAEVAGQMVRAERCYKAAQFLDEWCVQAVYHRAALYEAIGREDEAGELWGSIARAAIAPSFRAEAMVALADRAARADRYDDAHAMYTSALRVGAEDAEPALRGRVRADPLSGLGGLAQLAGRFGEASDLYRQAMHADPWTVSAPLNLAEILRESGRLGEGIEVLTQALANQTEDARLWEELAHLYEVAGETELA